MPVLGISDNSPLANGKVNELRLHHVKDHTGGDNYFLRSYGTQGGPAEQTIHFRGHELAEVVRYHWKRVDGGWLATSMSIMAFSKGKLRVQVRSVVNQNDLAIRAPTDAENRRKVISSPVYMLGRLLAPQSLGAQSTGPPPNAARDDQIGGGGNCGDTEISGPCSSPLTDYLIEGAAFAAAVAASLTAAAATAGIIAPLVGCN